MGKAPSINCLVEIILGDERTYRSRIEDILDGKLTVAPPMGVGDLQLPNVGAEFDLAWNDERARHLLPVRLDALTGDHPARWQVAPTGEARPQNRRLYVRGGGGEPVKVGPAGGAPNIVGEILEVSEGAVRCKVARCDVEPGEELFVHMTLKNEVVEAKGTVHSARRDELGRFTDMVVLYELPEAVAQLVRRYVFDRQMADRRARER